MELIESYREWTELQAREKNIVLFVKIDNCSVCEGLLPQIEPLEQDYTIPFYKVNVSKVPEIAGQLSLFTAPVVLLFNEGKEYARFARFVPRDELIRRLDELVERGN